MKYFITLCSLCVVLLSCKQPKTQASTNDTKSNYLDYSNRDDVLSGGVKMIPIKTDTGTFQVWTKRVGNNPKMKVLLLHGGPGATHEYFIPFDSYFPEAEIEYYYYDQLESAYSDQPNDSTLWSVDRYVDEVEQVRQALGLDSTNFYLLGHSWGGIVGMEYALKYQKNLKGLIISNMVASVPEYNKYAQEVLGPRLPPEVLKEVKALEANNEFDNPKYIDLLFKHFYTQHILRLPLEDWPNPVNRAFANINHDLYVYMQGPSEFGITKSAKLFTWDRSMDLPKISVPTLMIGATHDTMDPKYMEWMATQVQNGSFLLCPNGSHMAMVDDQKIYFSGLIDFVKSVDQEEVE